MRKLRLTIAYDGTRYAGWQIQDRRPQTTDRSRGATKPTIQGTIEAVLSRILQESVRVVGSGRTDAGVHALAQVAHVTTRSSVPRERLLRSLNQLLPPDVAVTRIEEADPSFHARFDAVAKRYRYRLFTGPVVPPFVRPYVSQVRSPLRVALMRREALRLLGRHDFSAFARRDGARPRRGRGSTRRLTAIALRRRGQEIHLEVEGNGFLRTMVRSLVGTLLEIGRGRLPPGTIRRMLRTRDRRLAGATASARGLTLVSVTYHSA